jgi:hypothetical protein
VVISHSGDVINFFKCDAVETRLFHEISMFQLKFGIDLFPF